jgi:hypothetical protein
MTERWVNQLMLRIIKIKLMRILYIVKTGIYIGHYITRIVYFFCIYQYTA